MGVNDILKETAKLKPAEKYIIIENLIQELNQIDTSIEKAWVEESEKRLKLYEDGELKTLSYEEVFNQ